jgi:probable HAF family extracellular repeat protein
MLRASNFTHAFGVVLTSALLASCGGQSIAPQLPTAVGGSAANARNAAHNKVLYNLIDLGSGSLDNNEWGVNGHPSLSTNGVMVGALPDFVPVGPYSNPSICYIAGPESFVLQAFGWQRGVFTNLGALGGAGDCSVPFAENSNGTVVIGQSENGAFDPQVGFNQSRAVRWVDGEIADLGSFGGNQNGASDVNTSGEIAGDSLNTTPDPYSLVDVFLYGSANGTQTRAFRWRHGKMRDLGTLGGNDAVAAYISDSGLIAGISYTNTTANPQTGVPTLDPFLWKNGTMSDLGTLGGVFGMVNAMNNKGDVTGESDLAGDQSRDPFLWNGRQLIDLATSTKGAQPAFANAINDGEEIVGTAAFSSAPLDAFLWKKGVATDLGHLSGDCFSEAFGINSIDQIVGNSLDCSGNPSSAFLWKRGTIANLNDLVPPSCQLHIIFAVGVNQRGVIVGSALDQSATIHAVLLVPTSGGNAKALPLPHNDLVVAQQRRPTPAEVAAVRAQMWRSHSRSLIWRRPSFLEITSRSQAILKTTPMVPRRDSR